MNSIDQRIVSMRFDNAQFESGAKESLKTLDTLKNSLNLEESSKGLKNLSVAPLLDGLSGLADGFNALDVVAITVISNITTALMNKLGNALKKTLGQIYSGGLKRATNLEQARFAMQGLLYDTAAVGDAVWRYGFTVEDVMGDGGPVQNAVRGTAYGLDEAAKAASNFIASGVTDLGELENVLKSISGTAAQTGATYDDIAHIYTRIAGNNRLYAIDLQSFASRGVNAAAAIRDYLNKLDETVNYTEADIRQLVSDGAINLELFSKAMYDSFGENAFRANETYAGSLSNLNAALSRVGAKFESAKLENMRDIFNALRVAVDAVSAALDPLIKVIVALNSEFSATVVDKVGQLTEYFKTFTKESNLVSTRAKLLRTDLNAVMDLESESKLKDIIRVNPFENLAKALSNTINSFKNIGAGIKEIFSPITTQVGNLLSSLFPITPTILKISEVFLAFTENFKNSANSIVKAATTFLTTNKFFLMFLSAVRLVTTAIKTFVKSVGVFFDSVVKNFGPVFTSVMDNVLKYLEPVAEKITNFFDSITAFMRERIDISSIGTSFSEVFSRIKDNLGPLETSLASIKEKIVSFFKSIVDTIHEVLPDLDLKTVFGWLLDFKIGDILKTFTGISNPIGTLLKTATDMLAGANLEESINKLIEGPTKIAGRLNRVNPILAKSKIAFDNLKAGIVDAAKGLDENEGKFTILDKIKNLVEKLGEVLRGIGTKISNVFTKIGEGIKNLFSSPLSNASVGLMSVGLAGFLLEMSKFVKGIRNLVVDFPKQLLSLMGAVEEAYVKFGDMFQDIGKAQILKRVKEFAIAILILVAALKILSTMNFEEEVLPAVGGLLLVIGELSLGFAAMSHLVKTTKISLKEKSIQPQIIAFASAVLIMAAAVKVLSDIPSDKLDQGVNAIEGITLCVLAYAAVMSLINTNLKGGTKGSSMLVSMGLSMVLMAKAIEKLGSIPKDAYDQGLAALQMILLFIGLYNLTTKYASNGASHGAGLILMATSLMVFAGAIQILALLKPEAIAQGLGLMATILFFVGFYMYALQEAKPMQAAAGLLIMSAALIALAGAILVLGNLPLDNLQPGPVIAMLAGLAAMVAALRLIGDKASIKSAAAIVIVSAAMLIFANALLILSLIPFISLAGNLLLIVGGLLALGLMGQMLNTTVLILIAMSHAFALFGLGLLSVAVAITLLTPVLAAFTVSLLGSLTLLIQGVIEMKDKIAQGLAAFIEIVLMAFQSCLDLIVGLVIELISTLLTAMQDLIAPVIEFLDVLITSIVDFLVEKVPYLADSLLQLINGVLESVALNISETVQLGVQIVTNLINGLTEGLPDLIDAGFNLIITLINGLADAIRNNAERLGEAAWNLISALFEGIVKAIKALLKNPIKAIKDFGGKIIKKIKEFFNPQNGTARASELMSGLKDGIVGKFFSIVDKIRELGSRVIEKLKEFISFDKLKEMGKNIINGLIEGIGSLASTAVEKIKEVGQNLLNGFKSFLGIQSPSTKFKTAGDDIIRGLNDGLSENETPLNTITSIASDLIASFTNLFSGKEGEKYGSDFQDGLTTGLSGGGPSKAAADTLYGIKNVLNKKDEFEQVGKDLMDGLKLGIQKGTPAVEQAASSAGYNAIRATKDVTYVQSPSKKFMEIGEYCMEGFAIGLSQTQDVEKKISSLKDIITDGLESKIGEVDTNPTITPILDLSNIQNGMSIVSDMFDESPRILGSVSGNMSSKTDVVSSAISALADKLNQKMDNELSPDEIYDAVRTGAANAKFTVLINGKTLTNIVNENITDGIATELSYLGG